MSRVRNLVLIALLLISSLAYGQDIMVSANKETDFSKYKTVVFQGWQKESDKQLNEFDQERLINAFRDEFMKRGITKDEENPDMAVTLYLVLGESKSVTQYNNWRVATGYGRPQDMSTHTVTEDNFKVGTLVVDIYDAKSKEQIWKATMQKVVQEKPKKREKSIPKAIAKLMKKYPVKPVKK